MVNLLRKYKDVISYLFFGVCTTLVNIVVYYLCAHVVNCSTLVSTIIAWVIACLFAYVTNRKWVFHSNRKTKKGILIELCSFFACRITTGVIDTVIMCLFVDVLHFNDLVIKVIANIIVIVLNYVASKLIIFNKNDRKKKDGIKNKKELLLASIIIAVFIAFFTFDNINTFKHSYIDYDSAYNATVAANMANSGKYMASYPKEKVFYNMITTGPVVLLPTALLYKTFGISNITSFITPHIYSCLSICLIFVILSICFKKIKFNYLIAASLTVLLCLSDGLFIYISRHLLGESAALFFVLLSALFLLISNNSNKNKYMLLSGGCLAVAFLTKSATIFILVSIIGLLLLETLLKRISIKQLLYWVVGFFIFFIVFDLFKLIQLGGIDNYIDYWNDEFKNMFNQSSGSNNVVGYRVKFNYLYDIFENNKFIALLITACPIGVYGLLFLKSIFKKKITVLKEEKGLYSLLFFGIAGTSLIVYFLLLGKDGLMYARRLYVNTLLIELFVIALIPVSVYYFRKYLKNKVILVAAILVLSAVFICIFPIYRLKNNTRDLINRTTTDDVRIVYLDNLYKTIDNLGDVSTLYTLGWWQEPNITLEYPKIPMRDIFLLPDDYKFSKEEYLLTGALYDGVTKEYVENRFNFKLTRINKNEIDYKKIGATNEYGFELFSIYKIEKVKVKKK